MNGFEERARSRRDRWTGGRARSPEELDEADLRFWSQASPSQRLTAVWHMAAESLTLRGEHEPHPDFRDLLSAFDDAGVEYLLIGGYAVAFHSRPRFTKDIDLWIGERRENVDKVHAALARFGAPRNVLDELERLGPEEILYLGHAPVRIDIMKRIPGVEFEAAYRRRAESTWDDIRVKVIGREDLIAAKRAAGRAQDRRDVKELERPRPRG